MFPVEAFQRTIEKFVSIAEQLEIPFHITGGAISSAYGEPRLTQDIDFVIGPQPTQRQLEPLIGLLGKSDFLFTESVVRQSVAEGSMFQLLDTVESLKLDVYPRELIIGELQRSEFAELFSGVKLPIVSRTDAALSKLIWVAKGSLRSRRDLRGIFRSCTPEQRVVICGEASKLGLAALLDHVLAEPDEMR